jgi:beta-catenin-like protein 1
VEARSRAIKTLDYAMSGPSGSPSCTVFVENTGLKPLFQQLMGTVSAFLDDISGC